MLHVSGTTWALTVGLIVVLLALDWLVIGRRPHHIGAGEATRWSLGYIGVALVFGAVLAHFAGWNLGAQYFTGYVVEKSLSVDNLFVFMLIISAFRVPANQQPRALTIGIAMALVLRTAFILLGAKLISTFSFMFLIFGLALVATSVQLYSHRNDDLTSGSNCCSSLPTRRSLRLQRSRPSCRWRSSPA